MIKRVWRGWTTIDNEDSYQTILIEKVIPGIRSMNIDGFLDITIAKRQAVDEIEFMTTMTFASLQSIEEFVGEDIETAHVPAEAQEVLKRWDKRVKHYFHVEENKPIAE